MVLGGLAALIFGGDKFVDSATNIARMLNISDKFIAVTILAGGTSMPELVTCVVAAAKKKGQLALGNILGSNIGNILDFTCFYKVNNLFNNNFASGCARN